MAIEDHDMVPIVIPAKNLCMGFCLLSNISKDAEFDGLSESEFNFLGRWSLTRLEVNY